MAGGSIKEPGFLNVYIKTEEVDESEEEEIDSNARHQRGQKYFDFQEYVRSYLTKSCEDEATEENLEEEEEEDPIKVESLDSVTIKEEKVDIVQSDGNSEEEDEGGDKPCRDEEMGEPVQQHLENPSTSQDGDSLASQGTRLRTEGRDKGPSSAFRCDTCAYTSCRKSDLKMHMRTHSGEKPFVCDVCPFAAARNGDLRMHARTHSGEKPFRCSVCPFASARKNNLNRHQERVHNKDILKKPFRCGDCPYETALKGDLQRHLRTHSGEKPFHCHICCYASARKGTLKKHMRVHAKDKKYVVTEAPTEAPQQQ